MQVLKHCISAMHLCKEAGHRAKTSHDSHNVGVPELGARLHIAENLRDGCKPASEGKSLLQNGGRHAVRWLLNLTVMLTLNPPCFSWARHCRT